MVLNNTAKTILDYQRAAKANLTAMIEQQRNRIIGLIESNRQLVSDNKTIKDSVNEIQKQVDNIVNPPKPPDPPKPTHIGKITDVSEWQGVIDWSAVTANDLSLAIIRIQDGSAHQDLKFAENLQKAISAGARYAVYAYFRGTSTSDSQQEARDFYNRTQQVVAQKQQPIFYALDVESVEMSGQSSAMRSGIEAYMSQLNSLGVPDNKIVLYIANQLYDSFNLNVARAGSIWLPSYGINNGTINGSLPPTHPYDLWQYTSKGAISGISGNVDMSTAPSERFKQRYLS